MYSDENTIALEQAVLYDTPEEVARMYEEFGEVAFTARALGYACRFRGLEMVKVLVEGGAEFCYELDWIRREWNCEPVSTDGVNYASALLSGIIVNDSVNGGSDLTILPLGERLAILDYLLETACQTGFDKDDLLSRSYFSNEREIRDRLKEMGAAVSPEWIGIITGGGRDAAGNNKWLDYCHMMMEIPDKDFMFCMPAFVSELGVAGKLCYTKGLWGRLLYSRKNVAGLYKFLIESFDLTYVDKKIKDELMMSMIGDGIADGLDAALKLGWLEDPQKRDEMIEFSAKNGKTECTALLLDYKNRTADLKAERGEAEKRFEL